MTTYVPATGKAICIHVHDDLTTDHFEMPLIAWDIDDDGKALPVIPWLRYQDKVFVGVYLPDKPAILYSGMIFHEPPDFVDHVISIVKRRKNRAA